MQYPWNKHRSATDAEFPILSKMANYDHKNGETQNHSQPTSAEASQKTDVEKQSRDAPLAATDGGWGWCIVLVAFYMNLTVCGLSYSSGVYFPVLLEEFGQSTSKTAWVGSLSNGCVMIVSPIAGALTNRFGCRNVSIAASVWIGLSFIAASFANSIELLIVTWGLFAGCGLGILFLPSLVSVGFWFEKNRGVATGIAVTGSGLGMFVFPTLSTLLIENYGWTNSLYALSGIFFFGALLSLLYRESPTEINIRKTSDRLSIEAAASPTNQSNTTSSVSNLPNIAENSSPQKEKRTKKKISRAGSVGSASSESSHLLPKKRQENFAQLMGLPLFRNLCFLTLLTAQTVHYIGLLVPFIYLADYAMERGIEYDRSSFLISIIGIANVISRPFIGLNVTLNWLDSVIICNYSMILAGIVTVILPFLTEYWMMCLYSAMFGLCTAGLMSTKTLVIIKLLGLDNLSFGLGYSFLGNGVAAMIGVPIIGSLHEGDSQSYTTCFILAGISIILGGIIGLPMQKLSNRQADKLRIEK